MSVELYKQKERYLRVMAETTTEETFESVAAELEQSQPQETTETTAESTTEETSQSDETVVTEPEEDNSDENADIKEWAAKKGLKLDDPIALAKAAREAEKAFHSKSTEASALKKSMGDQGKNSGETDLEAETYEQLNQLKVANFYQEHPEARELDATMAEILEEKPYLAQDLEALLAVAKDKVTPVKLEQARQEGQREERERIAQGQSAGAPKAQPTGKESTKRVTEADIENMSLAEYQALLDSGFNPYTDIA